MTTEPASHGRPFGVFDGRLTTIDVGGEAVALWQVDDLERHVDRRALLAGDDPAEPPYWAHLWSGAVVLARAVPARPGRVVEVGCGLGLPGVVAARRGGRVTFVDREPAPLAFVRASLAANAVAADGLVVGDFTRPPHRGVFDTVLGGEILYDRGAFGAIAGGLASLLAPRGTALLTDAARIDTRAFYPALAAHGLVWAHAIERVAEEGSSVDVRLVTIRHVDQRVVRGAERSRSSTDESRGTVRTCRS